MEVNYIGDFQLVRWPGAVCVIDNTLKFPPSCSKIKINLSHSHVITAPES